MRKATSKSGQGSVEYALVLAGLLAMFVALGALWRVAEHGVFVDRAIDAASHHLQAAFGWLNDVFIH